MDIYSVIFDFVGFPEPHSLYNRNFNVKGVDLSEITYPNLRKARMVHVHSINGANAVQNVHNPIIVFYVIILK